MFLHWKIPDRILEGSTSPSLASVTTPDLIRSSTLPEIGLSNHVHRPRPASQASVKRTPTRALGTPVSSARLFREQNHSKDLWALQVERTNNTKKSIARRMFTHDDQKHIMVNKIRKTLDPESRKYVDKWLETASEEDKQMAIKLFSTLDNNNLPDTEKQMRIEGVLKLIKRRSNGFTSYSSPDLSTNLKHLRLQDPHTRTNRWMHTTWHHLPQYLDTDPVNNTSSMYTKPHEPIPHDFVIHPDWG